MHEVIRRRSEPFEDRTPAASCTGRFACGGDPVTVVHLVHSSRHTPWSDRVLIDLRRAALDRFVFRDLPTSVEEARRALTSDDTHLILAFASRDSWLAVHRRLKTLGPIRPATLLATRGLGASELAPMLDGPIDDFFAGEFGFEEFLSRTRRLLDAPCSRRPAPAAQPMCDEPVRDGAGLAQLIGRDEAFVAQIERIPKMAASTAAALILGETGTGKELCAQALHYLSPRASGPWITVNCAAVPADLFEAELFGHAAGAYTSANQCSEGLIAQAEHGTLFLDEIDSLPLPTQAKLLRFIQDHEYRPLGGAKARRANVRVVAASNSDLAAQVDAGRFRRDLYFRLAVLTLRLPSLRERPGDLGLLADHLVERKAKAQGLPIPRLSPGARAALADHSWPGNVRELEHCLERAALFCCAGLIEPWDLELPAASPANGHFGEETFRCAKARVVRAFERQYLEHALRKHQGNISRAAAAASKNRRAFFELLRKHGIEADRFRHEAHNNSGGCG